MDEPPQDMRIPGAVLAIAGSAILLGWILDISVLKSVLPNLVSMKFNTALGFILCGVALLLQKRQELRGIAAIIVLVLGALTASEYLLNLQLGIDELFVKDNTVVGTSSPGRMSLLTALCFTAGGIALLLHPARQARAILGLASAIAGVAIVGLVGYIFSAQLLYGRTSGGTAMALHTSALFLVVAGGLFGTCWQNTRLRLLRGDKASAKILRFGSLLAIGAPLALVTIIALLANLAGASPALVQGILVVAFMALILATAWVAGIHIHRDEDALQKARLDLEVKTRRLEEFIASRQAEGAAGTDDLRAFASSVAHDIREPLLVLQLTMRKLRKVSEAGDLAEVRNRLEDMDEAIRSANSLASQLLDRSRSSSVLDGKPVDTPTDLEQCLEHALRDLQARIQGRNAQVVTDVLPQVQAPAADAKLILQNLIGNAIKYGGDPPRVKVRATEDGDMVRVEVEDNGPGVPPSQRKQIFEAFHQGNSQDDGVGLGLAICQRIAESHGGTVGLTPGEGGSIFWFTLPRVGAASESSPAVGPAS